MFISENFLLENDEAVELYHRFARDLPILDYHCHLPVRQVAEDHRFENLTQIWLAGDHYKWRAMRWAGVPERFCTGDASDWEKFQKWAETVPKTLGNPLYHWTHLELKRPFGLSDRLLGPDTARGIWEQCNALLAREDFSCRGIMRQMKVVLVCTTDDPTDTLEFHAALAADRSLGFHVLPAFRPDKALAVDSPAIFNPWVDRLAAASGIDVGGQFSKFLEALHQRHDHFHALGCRLSDHGLDAVEAEEYNASELPELFARVRLGGPLSPGEIARFRSAMLYEFALWDHARGWTQQFHLGALRNTSTRRLRELGPDTGFDSMGDWPLARPLARFLDRLDGNQRLARTILYNLNPVHNEVLAAMAGNFQDGSIPGKIQHGSAWWFLDQKDGMEKQLSSLANMGLLGGFVGMLTDSRSFLSYTRHEYFRRILCNLLGTQMHQGLLPRDLPLVGSMVQDICYRNAVRYFEFGVELPEV
ncbi:MAG: glucuronate isomerase [Thermoguttaceae bacterium]|jgi:glucuronate isomerase